LTNASYAVSVSERLRIASSCAADRPSRGKHDPRPAVSVVNCHLTFCNEAGHLFEHIAKVLVLLEQVAHEQQHELYALLLVTRQNLDARLEIANVLLLPQPKLALGNTVLRFARRARVLLAALDIVVALVVRLVKL
jgi:hypothetical protein